MKKIRIAAAGDNCMDVYDKENKAFPGGNPVNVAVYVARLGGASAYIGPVGTDVYGKQMMDAIQGKGVDVSRMEVCLREQLL
ncbi:MAG: PfkB family carbohydrate kinase [Coprococcus sp.]